MAKELFADYVKEKKLIEPEEKKELAQTLKTCYVEARKKGFVQCIIPGGVLPYMGYIGMCCCEGYGFQAVYSGIGYINQRVWV